MTLQIKYRDDMSKRGSFNVFGSKLQSVGKAGKEGGMGRREAGKSNRGNMTSFWCMHAPRLVAQRCASSLSRGRYLGDQWFYLLL